ncbi:RNA-directed DNA polymerase, eukaryota, Reverse transcriptase zinc-binding domain protein [Artemisia annua]|uniref:RNA-directed DNA polymerase, eukaryota, Reverse transcriptase zinc-binding domain protein n=1 Tax=Artemisia annua TaxID=35608 RepID=A0A2U1LB81_ARTAN|nr:RNA-directed DNA polymerase, eukaryota, Reverse transcriptase zinc-binding domain protein [Artemisia annua]
MNILSINIRGLKKHRKRVWIKDMCCKYNIHFLGVQETKMTKLELFRIKSKWGNFKFDYACIMARGRSGGLISIWDPNFFVKTNIWCGDNYVIVKGKWKNSIEDYYFINVYGPQRQPEKTNLWNFLRLFIQDHHGKVVLFGDLNEVRDISERYGSLFSSGDAATFNSFIQDVGLIDLPMGEAWTNLSIGEVGHNTVFHIKLKGLKHHLKQWYSQIKISKNSRKRGITNSLHTIKDLIDSGNATNDDKAQRITKLHELDNIEKLETLDLI